MLVVVSDVIFTLKPNEEPVPFSTVVISCFDVSIDFFTSSVT